MLGEDTYACPKQHMRENPQYWSWILRFYGFYKKGFLPEAGAIIDQTNKALSVFNILDEINSRIDMAEAEKRAQQAAKRGAQNKQRRGG